MSAQSDITGFLGTLAKGSESEWIPMDMNRIALQTGYSRENVNKTIYNLARHGKIEVKKGDNGRAITAYKVVDLSLKPRGGAAHKREGTTTQSRAAARRAEIAHPTQETPAPQITARAMRRGYPQTSSYAAQKARFDQVKEDFGDLVEATFKENPYAEEAVLLMQRLESLETQYIELRREHDETERELKYLRAKNRSELKEAAIASGAMVQHGD